MNRLLAGLLFGTVCFASAKAADKSAEVTFDRDQAGLRQVRYINGLYTFLDELAARHPGIILDNCASGGRRLDFEMMRRCVALWRSDSCWDDKDYPRNVQAMTHGLSLWIPLHGLGSVKLDPVSARSGMGACSSFAINYLDPRQVEALRKHLDGYLKIRPWFASDYYPLTDWSLNNNQWLAFQFNDRVRGEGILQAFYGGTNAAPAKALKLRGLDANSQCELHDWDAGKTLQNGRDLMQKGVETAAADKPRAIVIHYRKVKQAGSASNDESPCRSS